MKRETILKFIDAFAKTCHNVEATYDSHLRYDLGLDSLDILNLADELEEKYSINIDVDSIEDWKTVNDVVDTVYKLAE